MSKRKVSTTGWRVTSPMVMANRMVACHMLQEIGVKNLSLIPDEKLKELFLNTYIEEGEKGEDIEVFEMDWEFVLFCATDHELGKVFDFFQPKDKATGVLNSEAGSSINLNESKNEESKVIQFPKAEEKRVKERVIIEQEKKN